MTYGARAYVYPCEARLKERVTTVEAWLWTVAAGA